MSLGLVADHLLAGGHGNAIGQGGRARSGQLSGTLHEVAIEALGLFVAVAQHGGVEARQEEMVAPEARLTGQDVAEGAQKRGRGAEEDEGEGYLGHHEALAAPEPLREAAGGVRSLEGRDEVGPGGLERRHQAEGQHAQPRGQEAED